MKIPKHIKEHPNWLKLSNKRRIEIGHFYQAFNVGDLVKLNYLGVSSIPYALVSSYRSENKPPYEWHAILIKGNVDMELALIQRLQMQVEYLVLSNYDIPCTPPFLVKTKMWDWKDIKLSFGRVISSGFNME